MGPWHGLRPDGLRTLCDTSVVATQDGPRSDTGDRVTRDAREVSCAACIRSGVQASGAFRHANGLLDEPSPELQWKPSPETHDALVDLLRRVLAWRAQGAPSKWSSEPSKALALEADRVAERFPHLVHDLQPPPDDASRMRQARRDNDVERLRELIPKALRESYNQDPIIHAAFATAMYGGLSRESALIRVVQELCLDRARLVAQLLKLRREGVPDVVIHDYDGEMRMRLRAEPLPGGDAERAAELVARADRGEGRHDVKLVVDYLRAQLAEKTDGQS